jgi:hypothetical protein
MHSDTTHMHNENPYLESPNPLFSDMYILKLNFVGYGYTYTYHTNALLSIMHRDIYIIIKNCWIWLHMHIWPLCMCISRLFHIFSQQCLKPQELHPKVWTWGCSWTSKECTHIGILLQKQLSFDFFISFSFHWK